VSEFRTFVRTNIKGNTNIVQIIHRKTLRFKHNVKILLKNLFYSPYFGRKIKELTWFLRISVGCLMSPNRRRLDIVQRYGDSRHIAGEVARLLYKSFGWHFVGHLAQKINTNIYGCRGKRWSLGVNTNNYEGIGKRWSFISCSPDVRHIKTIPISSDAQGGGRAWVWIPVTTEA
jgi:hypothetical protein